VLTIKKKIRLNKFSFKPRITIFANNFNISFFQVKDTILIPYENSQF
jgi:hypothetical protein